jgi:Asp-tRNA(Asn)/Glu-tRNA(Gln) amidotransferase A subunit family amidase
MKVDPTTITHAAAVPQVSAGDLCGLTASELVRLIERRDVSAIDIASACVARTDALNPELLAWVSYDADYIMAQAADVDAGRLTGRLAGVPVGIKDIFNTLHYPTQKGSGAWAGYQAGNDARCVSYLRWQGGVVFGKTDTAELAVHANGRARNPHSLARNPGSSSSGSAVAVAAGMVPVALGTQTGGSTIRPASWCGIYAMKPSFGMIPRTGVLKTTDTLDTIGFFGRSVPDLEVMLDVLRVTGLNFPVHEREIARFAGTPAKWRIAFVGSDLWPDTPPYARASLDALRDRLATYPGVEIVDARLPQSVHGFHALHRRIYHADLGYYLRNEMHKAEDTFSEVLRDIIEDAKTLAADDYPRALAEQAALAGEIEAFFTRHHLDAVFCLASNGSAPIGAEPALHRDLNPLWTMTWLPVVNVPLFRDPDGFPFGLAVSGPKFSDFRLLRLLRLLSASGAVPERTDIVGPPFPA